MIRAYHGHSLSSENFYHRSRNVIDINTKMSKIKNSRSSLNTKHFAGHSHWLFNCLLLPITRLDSNWNLAGTFGECCKYLFVQVNCIEKWTHSISVHQKLQSRASRTHSNSIFNPMKLKPLDLDGYLRDCFEITCSQQVLLSLELQSKVYLKYKGDVPQY